LIRGFCLSHASIGPFPLCPSENPELSTYCMTIIGIGTKFKHVDSPCKRAPCPMPSLPCAKNNVCKSYHMTMRKRMRVKRHALSLSPARKYSFDLSRATIGTSSYQTLPRVGKTFTSLVAPRTDERLRRGIPCSGQLGLSTVSERPDRCHKRR